MKKISILSIFVLTASILFSGCSKDEDSDPIVNVEDFNVTIPENPSRNQSLGFVNATIENANNVGYHFLNENTNDDLSKHISLNITTGEINVTDSTWFDYEERTSASTLAKVEAYNSNDEMAFATFTITVNLTDVDDDVVLPLTVQQRLDQGETPITIYNSDNTLLDSLYGKNYAGGLIYYLDVSSGTGFVAAPNDQSTEIAWDPETNFINQIATGALLANLGDGATNTATIVAALTTGSYAAHICNDLVLDGYNDWFLPTMAGLDEMYDNLQTKGMGNFQVTKYWSSEEFDLATSAALWSSFDRSGGQSGGTSPKVALYGVRAARAF